MVYGYARCSTNESKQDISRQKRDLKALGAEEVYCEFESGTKINRPELNKILNHIQPGDTLVCTEISRITRSVKQLCEIIDLTIQKRLKLIVGGFTVDCSGASIDAMTEGMIKMMGVFAEMERKMTIERVKSGIAHARAKGVRLGRPSLQAENLPQKFFECLPLFEDKRISKADFARLVGVSRPTLYKYLAIAADK